MKQVYRRWMEDWEERLALRSTDRVVRPFEWGMDWTRQWPCAQRHPLNGHRPERYLRVLNQAVMQSSAEFFAYRTPRDFRLDGNLLRFTSPVETPYPENNLVHGQWFPARKSSRQAVVVLPHFNARAEQHAGLCRGLSLLGVSALRISLPYHDYRMPAELHRADYAVSANIARTIDATRQAVIDSRAVLDWLESEGYDRLGIVGTSLGSCYAFLVSAHDERLKVNVFNHCSSYFGDVVWTGLSTRHIRQGLEGHIDLDQLREAWMAISPVNYLEQYRAKPKKSLFIYTTFDTTFLPQFSRDIVSRIQQAGIDNRVVVLPCGHYTMGETPFKFIDGYHICSFLKKWL
ncbi:MAG: alpha/beta hydrolase family protein [Acidobacteria bacterium]|nr:alpha/beta hydrolase family protein [Acidobacteriota bacterium]